jgi:hypothetical protein
MPVAAVIVRIEEAEAAPAREVGPIIERASFDGTMNDGHLTLAQPPVLRLIGKARVLLTTDTAPEEIKEQLPVFCANGHDAPGRVVDRRRC